MLRPFLVYSKVIQSHIYIHILLKKLLLCANLKKLVFL